MWKKLEQKRDLALDQHYGYVQYLQRGRNTLRKLELTQYQAKVFPAQSQPLESNYLETCVNKILHFYQVENLKIATSIASFGT